MTKQEQIDHLLRKLRDALDDAQQAQWERDKARAEVERLRVELKATVACDAIGRDLHDKAVKERDEARDALEKALDEQRKKQEAGKQGTEAEDA